MVISPLYGIIYILSDKLVSNNRDFSPMWLILVAWIQVVMQVKKGK